MSKILQSVFEIVTEDIMEKDDTTQDNLGTINEDTGDTKCGHGCSLIADLKARRPDMGNQEVATAGAACSENDLVEILKQRYKKRGILISYDVRGSFSLRRLVRNSVKELKELGFEDDIWFDNDEGQPSSSSSFRQRLEVAEECNAALVFLSRNYFLNGPSKYEAQVFIQRASSNQVNPNGIPFRVYIVKCATMFDPEDFQIFPVDVDLTMATISRASVAEQVSVIVGRLSEDLQSCVTFTTKLYRELPMVKVVSELNVGYKGKAVNAWDIGDVQGWLCSLSVHERYRVSFEECEVDGYLLESLEEEDMAEFLGVDSRVTRQKIVQHLNNVLEKEKRTCWDECCRSRKARDTSVYLVCDPADAWIAEFITSDLMRIGIMVHTHDDFGSSKTTPFQAKSNSRYLSEAATVVFIMSSSTERSHFVFKELLLVAWLDKPILTAVFRNSWNASRYSLKAILGEKPAIQFARSMYLEGLEILRYHVTPSQLQTRAIFQRQYIQKMRDGITSLASLVSHGTDEEMKAKVKRPKVFLSYHWDMQNKVEKIKEFLNRHGCQACTDKSRSMVVNLTKPWQYRMFDSQTRTVQGREQRVFLQEDMSYCTVLVLCITLQYLHSDNIIKDTQLAQLHKKAVIPIMLQWCSRPLDRVASVARKLELSSGLIDMSTERLFQRNLPLLANLIIKTTHAKSLT